jgi:N-methylhydantoinase A
VLTPLEEADAVARPQRSAKPASRPSRFRISGRFRNPAHEQRTREILERELPGVYVSVSTEILPQIRV